MEALGGSLECARRALGELLERCSSFCCVPWATLSALFESRRLPRPENSEKLEFADSRNEIAVVLKAKFSINWQTSIEFGISLLNLVEFCSHLQNLAIWRPSEAPGRHFVGHRRLEDGIFGRWDAGVGGMRGACLSSNSDEI